MNITKSIANEKSTLALCGESCFKNPKCSYFSFNHKTLMCYLKKADKIKMSQESVGLICGRIPSRIKSRNWFTASGYQWDSGCDFRGNDFITKPMSIHTDCGEACIANVDCNYFTFNRLRSICFLKKWAGFFTESTKNADGAVCGFIPSRKQFKQEPIIKAIKSTTIVPKIMPKAITLKETTNKVTIVQSVYNRKETTTKATTEVKSPISVKNSPSSVDTDDDYEEC